MVLHLYDDDTFEFEQKPIDRSFFVDKKDGEIKAGWKDSYGLRKRCNGFADIKPGTVTVIYDRDIMWDPYEQAPAKDKPKAGALLSDPYFRDIAENTLNDIQTHNKQLSSLDRLIMILGVGFGVELLVFLIMFARSRSG